MKAEDNTDKNPLVQENPSLETSGIWEDAGFIPPEKYLHLIEYLHLAYLNGREISEDWLGEMIGPVRDPKWQTDGLPVVCDRQRMYSFAEGMGIDAAGDEYLVASKITAAIFAEYISCSCPSPATNSSLQAV